MGTNYTIFVGFKVSPQERQKLDMLARHTRRGISGVLRLLIAQAEIVDTPDIRLKPEGIDDPQSQPA